MIKSELRVFLLHPLTPDMIKYLSQLPQRFPGMFTTSEKRLFRKAIRESIK